MKPKYFLLAVCLVFTGLCAKAQVSVMPPPVSPTTFPDSPWEKISDKLKKDLSLDKSQKQGIKQAYKDYYEAVEKYLNSETDEVPKKGDDDSPINNPAVVKLINKRNARIKNILSLDQYLQYMNISKAYDQRPYQNH